MQLTFDEYDAMLEKFEEIETETIWPTLKQIDMFEEDPEKWLKFCCYLLEKGHDPQTKEEEYSKKNLTRFVNTHLELTD